MRINCLPSRTASASFETNFGSSIASSSPEFEVTSSDDLPF